MPCPKAAACASCSTRKTEKTVRPRRCSTPPAWRTSPAAPCPPVWKTASCSSSGTAETEKGTPRRTPRRPGRNGTKSPLLTHQRAEAMRKPSLRCAISCADSAASPPWRAPPSRYGAARCSACSAPTAQVKPPPSVCSAVFCPLPAATYAWRGKTCARRRLIPARA